MSQSTNLSTYSIAIVGLGLMGGSLALALRGLCDKLLAVDTDPQVQFAAKSQNIVDQISDDPAEILPNADLVILATPVRTILDLISQLPEMHPGSPIVMDIGSTKMEIIDALDALPERFDTIGGHPMCGKEKLTLANADAKLYQGVVFALTPSPRSSERARTVALQLIQSIGSRPLWIDAAEHDRWVAATSHLPYILASALTLATSTEAYPLVGSGYRSTSRLAATPDSMMLDVMMTNQANILESIKHFRNRLDLLEKLLARGDEDSLREQLILSASKHEDLK